MKLRYMLPFVAVVSCAAIAFGALLAMLADAPFTLRDLALWAVGGALLALLWLAREMSAAISPAKRRKSPLPKFYPQFGRNRLRGAILHHSAGVFSPRNRDDWLVVNGRWQPRRGGLWQYLFPQCNTQAQQVAFPRRHRMQVADAFYFQYANWQIPGTVAHRFLRLAYLNRKNGRGLSERYWVRGPGRRLAWWNPYWFAPMLQLLALAQDASGIQLVQEMQNQWRVLVYDGHYTFAVLLVALRPDLLDGDAVRKFLPATNTPGGGMLPY